MHMPGRKKLERGRAAIAFKSVKRSRWIPFVVRSTLFLSYQPLNRMDRKSKLSDGATKDSLNPLGSPSALREALSSAFEARFLVIMYVNGAGEGRLNGTGLIS